MTPAFIQKRGEEERHPPWGTWFVPYWFKVFYFCLCHALFDTAWGHGLVQQVPPVPFLRYYVVRSVLANEHANTWGQGYGRYPENCLFNEHSRI